MVMSEVAVNGDAVVGIDGGRDDDVNGDDGDGKTVLAATVAAGRAHRFGGRLAVPWCFLGDELWVYACTHDGTVVMMMTIIIRILRRRW